MDAEDKTRFGKLPVWAQSYINKVESERDGALRQLLALCGKASSIYIEDYGTSLNKSYVPDGSTMTFVTTRNDMIGGKERTIKTRFRVQIVNNGRDIDINSDDSIVVIPSASNNIRVCRVER